MKKVIYNKVLIATLFLGSPMVSAGNQYPAADFEPKVLYQDSDYKHQKSSTSSSSKSGTTSKPDPRYPAANFEPSVVYQDKEYKHTKSKASSSSQSTVSGSSESLGAEQEESSSTIFIGLAVLAIAGFMFFKQKSGGQGAKKKAPVRKARVTRRVNKDAGRAKNTAVAVGATGVARYLSKNNPAASTVAKYLASRDQTPTSGVAKYVAKKVVSAKQAAAAKTTGVEKYLKSRG